MPISTQNQCQFKSRTYPEWGEIFPNWDKKIEGYQFILDRIVETVKTPRGKSFIDVGCGYGYLSFALTDMGGETTALDVRKDRVKKMSDIKLKHGYSVSPKLIQAELKEWYESSYEKVDYTLWMNVMHRIGVFDGREEAFNVLNKMLDNSKGVFLMVRPYWTRTAGTWDIGRTHDEGKETLIEETGVELTDFGSVPHWQAGRHLYFLTR